MTTALAMHMANELLSLPVAAATLLLAVAAVAVASALSRRGLHADRLPLMGVMGAFVFAAQMINFTLPFMPGTSGHLGGGVLLAILLGPAEGIVTMAGILIIQCLLFQDGGLLALGCNVINMGVVPCVLGWVIYRAALGRSASATRQYLSAWLACIIGVSAGAALVPVEAALSGVLRIPWRDFLAVMVGVHLIIGTIEGLITFAVLAYLRQAHPQLVGAKPLGAPARLSRRGVAVSLVVVAMLLAGIVSWFASSHADGLEWSYRQRAYAGGDHPVAPPALVVAVVDEFQTRYTPLPDYAKRESPLGQVGNEAQDASADEPSPAESANPRIDKAASPVNGWGSLAGVVGTGITLGVLFVISLLMRRRGAVAQGA